MRDAREFSGAGEVFDLPTVTEHRMDGVLLLLCSGRLTSGAGAADFRDKLSEVFNRGERKILLDLGDVSYIDSMGVGELADFYTRLTNAGGRLKLVNVSKPVRDLFRTVRLDTVLEIHSNTADAVRSF